MDHLEHGTFTFIAEWLRSRFHPHDRRDRGGRLHRGGNKRSGPAALRRAGWRKRSGRPGTQEQGFPTAPTAQRAGLRRSPAVYRRALDPCYTQPAFYGPGAVKLSPVDRQPGRAGVLQFRLDVYGARMFVLAVLARMFVGIRELKTGMLVRLED